MFLTVLMQKISKVDADAAVVGWYEDVRPLKGGAGTLDWLLCGELSRLILEKRVRGSLGEVALLTTAGKIPASKIFLIGLGPRKDAMRENLQRAAQIAAGAIAGAGVAKAAIDLLPLRGETTEEDHQAVIDGLRSGTHYGATEFLLIAPDEATAELMTRLARS